MMVPSQGTNPGSIPGGSIPFSIFLYAAPTLPHKLFDFWASATSAWDKRIGMTASCFEVEDPVAGKGGATCPVNPV